MTSFSNGHFENLIFSCHWLVTRYPCLSLLSPDFRIKNFIGQRRHFLTDTLKVLSFLVTGLSLAIPAYPSCPLNSELKILSDNDVTF